MTNTPDQLDLEGAIVELERDASIFADHTNAAFVRYMAEHPDCVVRYLGDTAGDLRTLLASHAAQAETINQLVECARNLARCLLPINMGMMEREMVGDPIPPSAVVLSFMGSGASDSVTAHEVADALNQAGKALSKGEQS